MIRRFGIYSPVLGSREDWPSILLDKAFMPENQNVHIWNGEVQTAKMPERGLVRTTFAIIDTDTSGNSFTVAGDYSAHFTSSDAVGVYSLAGDYATFDLNQDSQVNGSGNTVIYVSGNVTDSTPNGYIFNSEYVGSCDPASVDFLKVHTPDQNPIMRYQNLVQSMGTEKLASFTKAHVYQWNVSRTRWDSIWSCSGEATYWDSCQYGDYMAATNNLDVPVYWDGDGANQMSGIDTANGPEVSSGIYISKAKFITAFENYLILGNAQLSDGNWYPEHIFWCAIGQGCGADSDWLDTGDGEPGNAYIDGKGQITGGFGQWSNMLIIFKRWSTRKLWFTGLSIPFNQDTLNPGIGSGAPGSVLNDEAGNLYFYGSDNNFHQVGVGIISWPINKTARLINPNALSCIRSAYLNGYGQVAWAIPYGTDSQANNKVILLKNGKWLHRNISVTAFGQYKRTTDYEWATLPWANWLDWPWDDWMASETDTSAIIDLCSDSEGYTYNLEGSYKNNGEDYTSSFVLSTDLTDKQALPYYKRVLQAYVYCYDMANGELTLQAKCDHEASWRTIGTVSMNGDETILRQQIDPAPDLRGRNFLIRPTSTDPFRFVGIEFEYIHVGAR